MDRRTFVGLGAATILSACNFSSTAPSLSPASVRMKWFFAGTMAFWFDGLESGAYEAHDIDLTIRPGGPDNSSVRLVAAGTDDFGVAGAEELLLARQRGLPVVAIGALFQNSPVSFVSHLDSGIETPAQWSGKRIEIVTGNSEEVQFRALCAKFAVRNVIERPYQFNLSPFLERQVDVSVAYAMDQAVILRRRGIQINEMRAMDFGVNPYGDVLITHERTLAERPELVRSFLQSTQSSIAAAIQNEARAVEALLSSSPELGAGEHARGDLEAVWAATIPFIQPGEGALAMASERWEATHDLLREFGLIEADVDLNRAWVVPN